VAPLQSYLVALYLIPERLRVDLQIHGYTASVVHDDDFQLEAFGNSHMTKYTDEFRQYGYAHGMASYGFEISVERSRLFYSGDIGSIDDVRDRLADFDLAVLEAFHVDADELLGFIPQSNVKQYVLSHLGDTESVSELSNKIAVRKLSNVAIAEDGQRWNM
jgi:ribonuclease BN (tRNA processing enzyme)